MLKISFQHNAYALFGVHIKSFHMDLEAMSKIFKESQSCLCFVPKYLTLFPFKHSSAQPSLMKLAELCRDFELVYNYYN